MTTSAMTTAQLATELDTTPRELRKFLRSQGAGVGKGARYALPASKREISAYAKKFKVWDDARNAAKSDNGDNTPETDNTPDATESD